MSLWPFYFIQDWFKVFKVYNFLFLQHFTNNHKQTQPTISLDYQIWKTFFLLRLYLGSSDSKFHILTGTWAENVLTLLKEKVKCVIMKVEGLTQLLSVESISSCGGELWRIYRRDLINLYKICSEHLQKYYLSNDVWPKYVRPNPLIKFKFILKKYLCVWILSHWGVILLKRVI